MAYTLVSPVDDLATARKATRQAAIAGFVSAAITLALVVWARSSGGAPFGGLLNLWSLGDVAVMLGLSYGTFRGNRFAAAGPLGVYVLNQIVVRLGAEAGGGIFLTLIFVLFFVQGVRGAFALHRLREGDALADALGV